LTLIVGAAGALLAFFIGGLKDAAGFAVGAAISLVSVHSWVRISEALDGSRPVALAALFMILRYALIGALVYAIVNLLGSSPVAMITGLLASFAAVVLEILYEFLWKSTN
jgi:hypothetical protein